MAQPSTAPTQMCMLSTTERTVQILWNSAIILHRNFVSGSCQKEEKRVHFVNTYSKLIARIKGAQFNLGGPTGNCTSYLCCFIALVLPLMLDRITRRAEIVRFHQCQRGCGNCPFWGLYLMPSLGCSKCTKTSGCLWSRVARAAALKKLNKWQQRRKKVTLSPHSTAMPQPRQTIFWLHTYHLSFLGGWYKNPWRQRWRAAYKQFNRAACLLYQHWRIRFSAYSAPRTDHQRHSWQSICRLHCFIETQR